MPKLTLSVDEKVSLGRSAPPTRRALMRSFAIEVHPLAGEEAEAAPFDQSAF